MSVLMIIFTYETKRHCNKRICFYKLILLIEGKLQLSTEKQKRKIEKIL